LRSALSRENPPDDEDNRIEALPLPLRNQLPRGQPPRPEAVSGLQRYLTEVKPIQDGLPNVPTVGAANQNVVNLLNVDTAKDTGWRLLQTASMTSCRRPTPLVER